MKVRSRKTMTKKWTFLFDSVMFSKSRTRVVIGVVVRVRIRFFVLLKVQRVILSVKNKQLFKI